MAVEEKTKNIYGFLWRRNKNFMLPNKYHFDNIQEVVNEPIIKGLYGIDIGSGCGYDTYIMAKKNPSVKIVSLEISDGVYITRKLTAGLKNVWIIKGSALNVPIKDGVFNFAYSFGVLHHTSDPEMGIKEIIRIIKKNATAYLYLYEDHSENRIKYLLLKIINIFRQITTRIPSKIMYFISCLASPFIFVLFSCSYRILKKCKFTRSLSEKMPFNFGTHPFSLSADLYDRFSAPIEHRFSKEEIFRLFSTNGFFNIMVERMKFTAGWVVWGQKR